uniref:Uncharacterized protein n=1 Tax=Hyaloperonospora arabidopsidis (strain Emoy2) TaxID=559515 RepID=M4B4L6_HYAAE
MLLFHDVSGRDRTLKRAKVILRVVTSRTTTTDRLSTNDPLYRQAAKLRQFLSGQPYVKIVLPAANLLKRIKHEFHLLQQFLGFRMLKKLERLGKRATHALYCSEAGISFVHRVANRAIIKLVISQGRNSRRRRRRDFHVCPAASLSAHLLSSGGSKALARSELRDLLFSLRLVAPKPNACSYQLRAEIMCTPARARTLVRQIKRRGHLYRDELGGSHDKHGTVGYRLLQEPSDMLSNETQHVTRGWIHRDLMAEGWL